MEYTDIPLQTLPANAQRVSIPTGGNMTWGAWTEILATTSESSHVCGLVLYPASANSSVAEAQIGFGESGVEVPLSTIRVGGPSGIQRNQIWLPFPMPVAAGVRLSVRMRRSYSTSSTGYVWLLLRSALPPEIQDSEIVCQVMPPDTSGITVSLGANWAFGAWTQFKDATAAVWHLTALCLTANLYNYDTEYEIGLGAAGSEVAVGRWRTLMTGIWGASTGQFPFVLGPVTQGSRVAIRGRTAYTYSQSVPTSLSYLEGVL